MTTDLRQIFRDVEQQTSADVWRRWDKLRHDVMTDPELGISWPDWCYVPMSCAYSVASAHGRSAFNSARICAVLQAAALWRPTMGVYRFDADLAAALIDTPLDRELPVDVLHRLPEWCVYIDLEGLMSPQIAGCWMHLESDANTGRPELRLVLHLPETSLRYAPIPIHLTGTLAGGILAMSAEGVAQAAELGIELSTSTHETDSSAGALAPIVSLALYLCTEEPDLGDEVPRKVKPRATKKRKIPMLQGASSPTIFRPGANLGARLRDATEGEGSVKAHVRRAHWHTYWVGSETKGNRRRELRWLSPILVGGESPTEPTVRRVVGDE